MRVSIILIGLGLMLGLPTSARAVDPTTKCNADKVKAAANYSACRSGGCAARGLRRVRRWGRQRELPVAPSDGTSPGGTMRLGRLANRAGWGFESKSPLRSLKE